jgi:hypothetical protein
MPTKAHIQIRRNSETIYAAGYLMAQNLRGCWVAFPSMAPEHQHSLDVNRLRDVAEWFPWSSRNVTVTAAKNQ